jgi:transposase
MSTSPAIGLKRARHRSRQKGLIHKPRGIIGPRVQRAGPEHFGIVSVDCAKARSKWLFADFYGNIHVPPTLVEHNREGFDHALATLRQAIADHDIRDLLVAVERTGRYHHPVLRAFANAGFEARTVHPFTTKQFRLPANPGVKTDDHDLAAIHRAAVNGFALTEAHWDPFWRELQLLTRHRRDLVQKSSLLCCQIKEHLEAALPGYAACFATFWENPAALRLALEFAGASKMLEAGVQGLGERLKNRDIGFQQRTLERILEWAKNAAPPDIAADHHAQIAQALDSDRTQKELEIQAAERHIASQLARTPYVLLMSIPGINVVSAAEYAGEMGPIANYANCRCITGRAGLYPARHQSDQVDHAGALVKSANKRLRFALMLAADNLIKCNHHFQQLARRWKDQGADPRLCHVRVAQRFSRISFHMVAGQQVFHHPAVQTRDYILRKLVLFHTQHHTPAPQMLDDLRAASTQLPTAEQAPEAQTLQQQWPAKPPRRDGKERKPTGPQRLSAILAPLLVELAGRVVQSQASDKG